MQLPRSPLLLSDATPQCLGLHLACTALHVGKETAEIRGIREIRLTFLLSILILKRGFPSFPFTGGLGEKFAAVEGSSLIVPWILSFNC